MCITMWSTFNSGSPAVRHLQDNGVTESMLRTLLTVTPLASNVAIFILESLVALPDEDAAPAAQRSGSEVSFAQSLPHLLLHQLEALDVADSTDEVLAAFLEAFEAAAPSIQAPLATLIGEMVPSSKAQGLSLR